MYESCWESKSEKLVGQAFKKRGIKIIPQYWFDGYRIDIYLPDYLVGIEVDGPHHVEKERIIKDAKRKSYIEKQGITIYNITSENAHIQGYLREFITNILRNNSKVTRYYKTTPLKNNQLSIEFMKYLKQAA